MNNTVNRRSILHLGNLGVKVDRVKESLVKVHGHGPVDTREDFISFHCIVLCVSKKNHVLNTKQVHFLTAQYPNTIDNFFYYSKTHLCT